MPIYRVEDDNGLVLKLEGNTPPTESELDELFAEARKNPSAYAAPKVDNISLSSAMTGLPKESLPKESVAESTPSVPDYLKQQNNTQPRPANDRIMDMFDVPTPKPLPTQTDITSQPIVKPEEPKVVLPDVSGKKLFGQDNVHTPVQPAPSSSPAISPYQAAGVMEDALARKRTEAKNTEELKPSFIQNAENLASSLKESAKAGIKYTAKGMLQAGALNPEMISNAINAEPGLVNKPAYSDEQIKQMRNDIPKALNEIENISILKPTEEQTTIAQNDATTLKDYFDNPTILKAPGFAAAVLRTGVQSIPQSLTAYAGAIPNFTVNYGTFQGDIAKQMTDIGIEDPTIIQTNSAEYATPAAISETGSDALLLGLKKVPGVSRVSKALGKKVMSPVINRLFSNGLAHSLNMSIEGATEVFQNNAEEAFLLKAYKEQLDKYTAEGNQQAVDKLNSNWNAHVENLKQQLGDKETFLVAALASAPLVFSGEALKSVSRLQQGKTISQSLPVVGETVEAVQRAKSISREKQSREEQQQATVSQQITPQVQPETKLQPNPETVPQQQAEPIQAEPAPPPPAPISEKKPEIKLKSWSALGFRTPGEFWEMSIKDRDRVAQLMDDGSILAINQVAPADEQPITVTRALPAPTTPEPVQEPAKPAEQPKPSRPQEAAQAPSPVPQEKPITPREANTLTAGMSGLERSVYDRVMAKKAINSESAAARSIPEIPVNQPEMQPAPKEPAEPAYKFNPKPAYVYAKPEEIPHLEALRTAIMDNTADLQFADTQALVDNKGMIGRVTSKVDDPALIDRSKAIVAELNKRGFDYMGRPLKQPTLTPEQQDNAAIKAEVESRWKKVAEEKKAADKAVSYVQRANPATVLALDSGFIDAPNAGLKRARIKQFFELSDAELRSMDKDFNVPGRRGIDEIAQDWEYETKGDYDANYNYDEDLVSLAQKAREKNYWGVSRKREILKQVKDEFASYAEQQKQYEESGYANNQLSSNEELPFSRQTKEGQNDNTTRPLQMGVSRETGQGANDNNAGAYRNLAGHDKFAFDSLVAAMERNLEKRGITSTTPPLKVVENSGATNRLIAALRTIFPEIRVVTFEGSPEFEDAENGEGIYYKGTIFLNSQRTNSELLIIGHELSHRLFDKHPELKQYFYDFVKTRFTAEGQYKFTSIFIDEASRRANKTKEQITEISREEVLARLGSQFWTDTEFLKELERLNQPLAQRVLKDAIKIIGDIINAIGGTKEFSGLVSDLDGVRRAYAKIVYEASKAERGNVGSVIDSFEPLFSRVSSKRLVQTDLFNGGTETQRQIEEFKRKKADQEASNTKGVEDLPLFNNNESERMKGAQQTLFSRRPGFKAVDTESPEFKKWFGDSKVVDDNGNPLIVYSGHSNVEMYGSKYEPRKGTAGGFYATEDPAIASNYSTGKMGSKEYYENGDQYRLEGKNGKLNKKIWQYDLSEEQKKKLDELTGIDENGEEKFDGLGYIRSWADSNKNYDKTARALKFQPYSLLNIYKYMEEMGYNIAYDSHDNNAAPGTSFLRQNKNRFENMLDALGIRWNSSDWQQPGVYPLYLSIQNPIDAEKPFPEDLLKALDNASKRERNTGIHEQMDYKWTRNYPMKQWVKDIKDGDEYWSTHIPSKALPIIKQFGYDGIKELGNKGATTRAKRQTNWIAFEPAQIKSATSNTGEFSSENPDIRFSRRNNYDPTDVNSVHDHIQELEREAEQLKAKEYQPNTTRTNYRGQDTTIGQMNEQRRKERLAELQNEIDYATELRGQLIDEMFNGKPDAEQLALFSRSDVNELGFYSALSRAFDSAKQETMPAQQWSQWLDGNAPKMGVKKDEIEWSGIKDFLNLKGKEKLSKADIQAYLEQNGVTVEETKKGRDPDVQRLRDLQKIGRNRTLLEEEELRLLILRMINGEIKDSNINVPKYGMYQLPGGKNYKELLLTLPDNSDTKQVLAIRKKAFDDYSSGRITINERNRQIDSADKYIINNYKNYKSSHFDEPNVLAHVRMNERTDADGNKVLFVEELQSDWAQEGRKKGFSIKTKPQIKETTIPNGKPTWEIIDSDGLGLSGGFESKEKAEAALRSYPDEYNFDRVKGVPNAPFITDTKSWLSLAIKRILRYAVDNGFDKIAWTTGKQQTERYDLSKQINSVTASRMMDDEYDISVSDKNGNTVLNNVYSSKELPDVIGKELADKIVNQEESEKTYSGLDLQVGGEGMKSFYDRIVPQVASDVLKKIGGGKVGVDNIDGLGEQPSITITPAMKETISEGLPLFSRAKRAYTNAEITQLRRARKEAYDSYLKVAEDNGYGKAAKAIIFDIQRGNKKANEYPRAMEFAINEVVKAQDVVRAAEGENAGESHALVVTAKDFKQAINPMSSDVTVEREALLDKLLNKYHLRQKIFDRFDALKKAQEKITATGAEIAESANAYLGQLVYHGKAKAALENFEEAYLQPIERLLSAYKMNIREFGMYLYALHAPERNEHIRNINPEFQKVIRNGDIEYLKPGSGMPDPMAAAVIDYMERKFGKKNLSKLADLVNGMRTYAEQHNVESGLQTQELRDKYNAVYKDYVPLKRTSKEDVEAQGLNIEKFKETDDLLQELKSKGFSVEKFNDRALGRTTLADPDMIFANLVADIEADIVAAHKNNVAQKFLNMVQANPMEDLWEIVKDPPTKPIFNDKTGLVERRVDPSWKKADDIFSAMVNGEPVFIRINDKQLARSMKNLSAESSDKLIPFFGKMTRFLAGMSTRWNPEFGPVNALRDLFTAAFSNFIQHDAKTALAVLRATRPAFWKLWKYSVSANKRDAQFETVNQFRKAGGRISYLGYEELEKTAKRIQKEVDSYGEGKWRATKRFWSDIATVVGGVNDVIENAGRLATFEVMLKKGMSPAEAAAQAKDITVNFNQRGEWGNVLNSLWMFSNAALQGLDKMARLYKARPQKFMATVGGLAAIGFAVTALMRWIAPDDEDGKDTIDKAPSYIKERNLLIPIGKDGQMLKIPLPYGPNFFFSTGAYLNDMAAGQGVGKTMGNILASMFNAFNPLGGSDFPRFLTPTVVQPAFDVAMNKDWRGKPLFKTPLPGQEGVPSYRNPMKSTREHAVRASRIVNSVTGGDQYNKGAVDIPPEAFQMIENFLFGGAGAFAFRSGTAIKKAATGTGGDLTSNDVPFVRAFYQGKQDQIGAAREYWANKKEADNILRVFLEKRRDKDASLSSYENEMKPLLKSIWLPKEVTGSLHIKPKLRYLSSQISDLNERITDAEAEKNTEDNIPELKQQLTDKMIEYNKTYNEAMKAIKAAKEK